MIALPMPAGVTRLGPLMTAVENSTAIRAIGTRRYAFDDEEDFAILDFAFHPHPSTGNAVKG